jgi:transposase
MTAVGIDVGKAALDVFVDEQASGARYANTRAGIAQLVRRLRSLDTPKIVVEATGGYEEPLLDACCDAGFWVSRCWRLTEIDHFAR